MQYFVTFIGKLTRYEQKQIAKYVINIAQWAKPIGGAAIFVLTAKPM